MDSLMLLRREGSGHGLSLGWLLAIAIGGGILLFTAIGLLLSWRIKGRPIPQIVTMSTRHVSDGSDDHSRQKSSKRLQKRRNTLSQSASRISLSLPPVLPPLPSYHSFDFFNTSGDKKRSKSWIDEDKFHGPKVNKNGRESWFRRDSWFGRSPTLPSLMLEDAEKGQADRGPEQTLYVQKRRSAPAGNPTTESLRPSRTAPALPMPVPSPERIGSPSRGRPRAPAQAHVRPSVTDSNLKHILLSTEQRLREGHSQSPTKTPRPSPTKVSSTKASPTKASPTKASPTKASPTKASPTKASPTKTPHSCRTISSYATVRTSGSVQFKKMAASPGKRATIQTMTPHTASRNASISSVGSAANSLIAEASHELDSTSGLASPSQTKDQEKAKDAAETTITKGQQQQQQQGRMSQDSNASSTLSTLYSADEGDDRKSEKRDDDPFFDQGKSSRPPWQTKQISYFASHRRTKTMSALGPINLSLSEERLVPPPLRPLSLNAKPPNFRVMGPRPQSLGPPMLLHPPPAPGLLGVKARDTENIPPSYSVSPSFTSFVTASVSTDNDNMSVGDSDEKINETPKPEWLTQRDTSSPLMPGALSPSTITSSPFDEQDILSMLLSTSAPRRDLPVPPLHISHVDEDAMPTPLSPRPRRDFSSQLRKLSNSSTFYDDEFIAHGPAAVSTGSPSRKRSLREPSETQGSGGSLGSAIAELRRMDSMVSSYSATSVASTARGESDSPTLPTLRGGGFSPGRTNSKASRIGRHNYLSVGSSSSNDRSRLTRRSIPASLSHETRQGKENQGQELKIPRIEVTPGLRPSSRPGNLSREASTAERSKLNPLDELAAEHRRQATRGSLDSLGLYDKDGFLKSSPDSPTRGRCLRM